MARRRPPPADPSGIPAELRPAAWEAWADPADLDDADPITFRARAQRRQSQAIEAWAAEQGMSWAEACRRVGR